MFKHNNQACPLWSHQRLVIEDNNNKAQACPLRSQHTKMLWLVFTIKDNGCCQNQQPSTFYKLYPQRFCSGTVMIRPLHRCFGYHTHPTCWMLGICNISTSSRCRVMVVVRYQQPLLIQWGLLGGTVAEDRIKECEVHATDQPLEHVSVRGTAGRAGRLLHPVWQVSTVHPAHLPADLQHVPRV